MNVLILGGDGYLGWATAMSFAAAGHKVSVVDNYLRRNIAKQTDSEPLFVTEELPIRADIFKEQSGYEVEVIIGDCADADFLSGVMRLVAPDCVIHYAEQPSAPYSMRDQESARQTFFNNLGVTFNLIWAVIETNPACHIVKLGTMGEYGTPNIDIEEGWLDVQHKGRSERFLYPRQAGSLYHTTKVLDTDLLWFYVRLYGLSVTDLMQGPVYGFSTAESDLDDRLLPNFHYDDIFGTVVNRFITQAVIGMPLTVYGQGGQTRGYLNLVDTLQCVRLAMENPPDKGELRILNQFTEAFSVNELAERVHQAGKLVGLDVKVQSIDNPRQEMEDHYYNAAHSELIELGLNPTLMSDEILAAMMTKVMEYRNAIDEAKLMPRVKWN
jgi:UDP-sulfoquinovose synthase